MQSAVYGRVASDDLPRSTAEMHEDQARWTGVVIDYQKSESVVLSRELDLYQEFEQRR